MVMLAAASVYRLTAAMASVCCVVVVNVRMCVEGNGCGIECRWYWWRCRVCVCV